MERYQPLTPRRTLAVAAALATLATLSAAMLPARMDDHAAPRVAARAPVEVAIIPARIDVVGARRQNAAQNDAGPDEAHGRRS